MLSQRIPQHQNVFSLHLPDTSAALMLLAGALLRHLFAAVIAMLVLLVHGAAFHEDDMLAALFVPEPRWCGGGKGGG